jgi:hypothetical protein
MHRAAKEPAFPKITLQLHVWIIGIVSGSLIVTISRAHVGGFGGPHYFPDRLPTSALIAPQQLILRANTRS